MPSGSCDEGGTVSRGKHVCLLGGGQSEAHAHEGLVADRCDSPVLGKLFHSVVGTSKMAQKL